MSLRWGCGYGEHSAHRGHHGAAASPFLSNTSLEPIRQSKTDIGRNPASSMSNSGEARTCTLRNRPRDFCPAEKILKNFQAVGQVLLASYADNQDIILISINVRQRKAIAHFMKRDNHHCTSADHSKWDKSARRPGRPEHRSFCDFAARFSRILVRLAATDPIFGCRWLSRVGA